MVPTYVPPSTLHIQTRSILTAALLSCTLVSASCDETSGSSEAGAGGGLQRDGGSKPDEPDAASATDSEVPDDAGEVEGGLHEGEPPRAAFRPEQREATAERVGTLVVPEGFKVQVFARDLGHARMLASHGPHLYLTRPRQGDVLQLMDDDADGVSEAQRSVATGLMGVHGIAFHAEQVFLATPTQIYRAPVQADGRFGAPVRIIDDLPDGGQHPNRTLAVGPDGKLYISVGSSCDACEESNPEHATLLRADLNGTNRIIFASGLRNTLGFAWHPTTGELWGMDQGSDWRGDDLPPEELNQLRGGSNYGWPFCFADRQLDPIIQEPSMGTKEAFCEASEPPALVEQAHGSPLGLVFYTADQFPEEYLHSAFVPWRGSWNRYPATGYKIARLIFEDGAPKRFEDFLTGFLIEDGNAEFGRPTGLTIAQDGSLLFSDDERGIVYRVHYAP
jgi:glucose/arabinose dehydrogenase